MTGHKHQVLEVQWNKDETQILSVSRDGTVRVWDANTEMELYRLDYWG